MLEATKIEVCEDDAVYKKDKEVPACASTLEFEVTAVYATQWSVARQS